VSIALEPVGRQSQKLFLCSRRSKLITSASPERSTLANMPVWTAVQPLFTIRIRTGQIFSLSMALDARGDTAIKRLPGLQVVEKAGVKHQITSFTACKVRHLAVVTEGSKIAGILVG